MERHRPMLAGRLQFAPWFRFLALTVMKTQHGQTPVLFDRRFSCWAWAHLEAEVARIRDRLRTKRALLPRQLERSVRSTPLERFPVEDAIVQLSTTRSGPQCFDSIAISLVAMTLWHGKSASLAHPAAILEFNNQVTHDDTHAQLPSLSVLARPWPGNIILSQATVPGLEESGNVTIIPARVKSHD